MRKVLGFHSLSATGIVFGIEHGEMSERLGGSSSNGTLNYTDSRTDGIIVRQLSCFTASRQYVNAR